MPLSVSRVVSIILPVHNGALWLKECLESVFKQSYTGAMELCVFDDSSTDQSIKLIENFIPTLRSRNINVIITAHEAADNKVISAKGCGYAKNKAVNTSTGDYLCFLDADDVMHSDRIELQLKDALRLPNNTIIGCQVVRDPPESTVRYTRWINKISSSQLYTQIYTSNGPTVVMPTWFCHRSVFDSVGGFSEEGKGVPEDYIFFLKFLKNGGQLHKVDRQLLTYRYHPNATTFSVAEDTIWKLRLKELEENVLSKWKTFTIWNAGKQGRKFYRDISDESRQKVACFCDVDEKKINKGVYIYELSNHKPKTRVPIVHFKNAPKPFVICVKLDLSNGVFESNLSSLNLTEGVDYFHFN